LELLYGEHDEPYILEQLTILTQKNEQMHFEFHASIQAYCKKDTVLSDQLSTLFNVNREVWQSGKSLIDALYFWYGYQK
jgi:hypothetical protein